MIHDILSFRPGSRNFDSHLKTLEQKKALRMAQELAYALLGSCADNSHEDAARALGEPVTAILDTLSRNRSAKETPQLVDEYFQGWLRRYKGEEDPYGAKCSVIEINERFRGLHAGQTIVISGFPQSGKSILGMQLALDINESGGQSLFISCEMTAGQLIQRCFGYISRLPVKVFDTPREFAKEDLAKDGLDRHTLTKMKNARATLSTNGFHIEEAYGPTGPAILAAIRRRHRKNPLRVVVFDYMQRITPQQGQSLERALTEAAQQMADLARELGFTLILLSQLNKDFGAKHAEGINEAADLHLKILIDNEGPTPTKEHQGVYIAKDRHHGHSGETIMVGIVDTPAFQPITRQEQPKPTIKKRTWDV